MMPIADIVMVGGLLLFAAFMMKTLFQTRAFLRHLEEHHPGEFAKLGFPHWKIQWGDRSLRLATKYIRKRQFEALNDEVLETSYRAILMYERFAWLAGAVAIVAAITEPFFK